MEGSINKNYKNFKIALVGGEELSLGFKLAGVHDSFTVETVQEGEAAIRSLMERPEIGIIIISSRISKGIKDRKILNAIDTSIMPIFIEVPDYGSEYTPDTLRKLILRAIGIDISKTIGS